MQAADIHPRPSVATIAQRVEHLEERVHRHDVWVDGNGSPGAKVVLATMQTEIKTMSRQVQEIKDQLSNQSRLMWGMVITLATGLVMFFATQVMPTIYRGGP